RAEAGVRAEIAPGHAEQEIRADVRTEPAAAPHAPADRKDERQLEIDVRTRTDVRTDIPGK
ncbi:MAG: hypothetical protein FJZ01_26040, partial [Candidatus Sericytochromatia bacterium]|nr:hypothetical protein [Candidatus Tanganyikabacteria bacterium]